MSETEWDKIPVTHEQARKAVLALVDEHFNNPGKPRPQFSVPARSDDADMLLMRYIKQQEAATKQRAEQVARTTGRNSQPGIGPEEEQ